MRRREERGFLLISVYMLLSLILVITGTMLSYAWTDIRASIRTQASTQAFYFAEAGLDNAIVQLRTGGSLADSISTSVGNYGSYSVTAEDLGNNRLRLTSTGTSTYLTAPITKSLESIVEVTTEGNYFKQSVFGNRYVTLSSNAKTDSYLSSDGAYSSGSALSNGDVRTNGTLRMIHNAQIHGDVYTTPEGDPENDMIIRNSASYTGTAAAASEAREMAAVEIPDELTDGGALTLSGGTTLTLTGGTYWYSGIQISNSAKLIFTSPTTLYLTGGINLSNSAQMYASGNLPSDLLIQMQGSSASLNNSSQLYAGLYAPNASVALYNNAALYGAVMANEVVMSHNSGIHYDEALYNGDQPENLFFGGGGDSGYSIRAWGVPTDMGPPSQDTDLGSLSL